MYPILIVSAGLVTITVFVVMVLVVITQRHPTSTVKPYSEGLFRTL
jgi:hypothetical protein